MNLIATAQIRELTQQEKTKLAAELLAPSPQFQGSITIHYAGGNPKVVEQNEKRNI